MQVPIFSIPDCQKAYKGHTNIKTSMLCAGGIGKGTSWVSLLLVGPFSTESLRKKRLYVNR